MDLLLAHIPHLALLIAVALLFVRMMIGERRVQLAVAHGGSGPAAQVRVLGLRGALRTLLVLFFLAVVVVLAIQVLRDQRPSAVVVVDYLLAGGIMAIWMAWSAPSGLAPGVQRRLGVAGRAVVRVAIGGVALGSLIVAGMALAHGTVLPPL